MSANQISLAAGLRDNQHSDRVICFGMAVKAKSSFCPLFFLLIILTLCAKTIFAKAVRPICALEVNAFPDLN